jgi:hypothetical protein
MFELCCFWFCINFPKNFEYIYLILARRFLAWPVTVKNKRFKDSISISLNIQVGIFELWDWVYKQVSTGPKLVQTLLSMVVGTRFPVLRKFRCKKSYLERVGSRTQSQHFQTSKQEFRPHSWKIQSSELKSKISAL